MADGPGLGPHWRLLRLTKVSRHPKIYWAMVDEIGLLTVCCGTREVQNVMSDFTVEDILTQIAKLPSTEQIRLRHLLAQ